MNFSQRLRISSLISFGMLLIVVPIMVHSYAQRAIAEKRDILADDIQTVVFQRVTLRDHYFLFGSEDSRARWHEASAKTALLLKEADAQFASPEERRALRVMRENFQGTLDLFQRLYERGEALRPKGPWRLHNDQEGRRLYTAIMGRAAALQEASGRLQQLSRTVASDANGRLAMVGGLFICVAVALTILNASLVHRLLRRRLQALHQGAATIAAGALDHRIDCEGSDELAELGRVLNDMTERVQDYTRELKKSHDLLDALSSQVPGILFQAQLSPDGRFSIPYASDAMRDLYEVAPEEAARDVDVVFSRFHPDDRDGLIASFHRSAETATPWSYEYRFVLPSKVKWCYGVARPRRLSDGTILWNGFIADITLLKELEQKLRESKTRYRSLFDYSSDAIMLTRPDGHIVHANRAACQMLGWTEEELRAIERGRIVDTEDPRLTVALKERSETGLFRGELTFIRKDGGRVPVEITSVMFRDRSGQYECSIIARDITARKINEQVMADTRNALEQQVTERTRALHRSNELLLQEIEERKKGEKEILESQLQLEELSHELALAEERERDRIAGELHDQVGQRLILAKMKLDSLASLLCADELGSAAQEVTRLVSQTIQDIRTLTFQIRPPLLASAGLEAAVQWLGEEMKQDYGLTVEFSDDNSPKPLKYEVRSTVFQAVRELLMNVAKHAGTSRVRVAMAREAELLAITVQDDGVGFLSSETSGSGSRRGGFGLYNVRRRIRYLGGSVSVDSGAGRGTKVTVMVPLSQAQEDLGVERC